MTVFFIGAGPGDPELITVRGLRLIERCPLCLYAGSLVPQAVVAAAPDTARVVDTASLTLDDCIGEIRQAHDVGHDVARVHSGDPSLYGAIAEQIRRLKALGIDYQIVPGVSAYAAAAAGLGIELTMGRSSKIGCSVTALNKVSSSASANPNSPKMLSCARIISMALHPSARCRSLSV